MQKAVTMGRIFGWLSFALLVVGLAGFPFAYGMEPIVAGIGFLIIDAVLLISAAVLAVGWAVITLLADIAYRLPPNTY